MNWLKKINDIKTADTSDLVKKTAYNKKKLIKKKDLIIMINILQLIKFIN